MISIIRKRTSEYTDETKEKGGCVERIDITFKCIYSKSDIDDAVRQLLLIKEGLDSEPNHKKEDNVDKLQDKIINVKIVR